MRATQNSNGMSVAEGWKRLGAQSEFTLHQRSWIEPTIDWTLSYNQPRLGSGQVAANLPLLATGTPSPITHTHFPGQWKQAFSDSLPAHTESQPNSAVWEKPKISPNGKNLQNILLYPKSLLYSDSHHLIVWLRKKKIPYSSQDPAKRTENSRNGFLHFSKDQLEEAVEIVKIISKNKCSEGWLLALTSC